MYRDHLYAARCRQQLLGREGEVEAVPSELARLFARRAGRIWGALLALLVLPAMAVHALATMSFGGIGTYLVVAWGGMGVTYLLVRGTAHRWLRWRLQRAYATSGDIFYDLGRLDAERPHAFLLQRVHRLERASLQLPLLAVSLLAPLSIHLLVALVFLGVPLAAFGQWVLTSMVLVGHAHLTLALFALFHVVRVQRELDVGMPVSGASRGLVALLWTVGASAVPGVVLLCVPPLLVAMTGLLFVPWMFHWVGATALVERMVLVDQGLEPAAPAREVIRVCCPARARAIDQNRTA